MVAVTITWDIGKNKRIYMIIKIYTTEIKIDKKSHKKILIYYNRYVMVKDLRYIKINSVNALYLKMNVYFEEINGNKYLTLVTTYESKEIMKDMKNYGPK